MVVRSRTQKVSLTLLNEDAERGLPELPRTT